MDLQGISVADSGMNNNNSGGYYDKVFVAKASDVDGIVLNPAPTTPEESVEIAWADITIGGTGLVEVACQEGSVSVTDEEIGETDGISFKTKLTFNVSTHTAKNLGFSAMTTNAHLVYFVIDFATDKVRVIGTDKSHARREAGSGVTGGGKREDYKHGQQTWVCYGTTPAPFVTGATVTDLEGAVGS